MNTRAVIRGLIKIRGVMTFARLGQRPYRTFRTWHLSKWHPQGGYLRCNGIDVFCNFKDRSYTWYDGPSSNLALDQRIIDVLAAQSAGNVFIDIGAHFGFSTAYLSRVANRKSPSPRVIALEPDPEHFRCLRKTLAACPTPNTLLLPFAISDADRTVALYKTSASCLHTYREDGAEAVREVPAISLDSLVCRYLNSHDKVALIKIDVDGAEPLLLPGGAKTFQSHAPLVVMEFAPAQVKGFGLEPYAFYEHLCESFIVYWANYQHMSIRRVSKADYAEIRRAVGRAITDLVLSKREISFGNLVT